MTIPTTETYQGKPLLLEIDITSRNGHRVAQSVSLRLKGTRQHVPISLLGAWQHAQVQAARLPERTVGMTPRRRSAANSTGR